MKKSIVIFASIFAILSLSCNRDVAPPSAEQPKAAIEAPDKFKKLEKVPEEAVKPFYQGEVINIEQGGAYTYLEIKEKTDLTFWVAVQRVEPKIGDVVRFQKEMHFPRFKSETLNKTFDNVLFGSNLQYLAKN